MVLLVKSPLRHTCRFVAGRDRPSVLVHQTPGWTDEAEGAPGRAAYRSAVVEKPIMRTTSYEA